jgi:hypothetical protein
MMKSLLAKLKAWWKRMNELYEPKQLPEYEKPKPEPVPVKPDPVDAPVCGCPVGKSDYVRKDRDGKVVREIIVNGYLPCELRALLNDGTDRECGIADYVQKARAARVSAGKLYVNCFPLPNGSMAHYIGSRQPSSSSPLVRGQGVPVGSGLLRLYFEGRK